MFTALKDSGMMYDSSLTVREPSWPFSLNRKVRVTCYNGQCPTKVHK